MAGFEVTIEEERLGQIICFNPRDITRVRRFAHTSRANERTTTLLPLCFLLPSAAT